MELQKVLALRGPNIWARFPVLEAWVELGDLKDSPSNEMPGFNERIMGWLPTMIEHRCSIGERGGFFERLRRGTYLAHILEHVTLELQARAGCDFGFGRARETLREGLFRVAIQYDDETVGRACLEAGRRLCLAAVHNQPYDVAEEIRKLRELADDMALGPSTRTIVEAATARGIPTRRLNAESLVQLGDGARQRRVWTAVTDRTGAIAEQIAKDKELTRSLLRQAGVPVPAGRPVKDPEDAWRAAQEIGGRVVVKPQFGNQGDGVVIGISKREQIEAAYRFAAPFGNVVMVEQLALGAEHRLLVVGGKLIAANRGDPAVIVGDGRQNVRELIASQLNSDPRRSPDLSSPLMPIELNAKVLLVLEQEGCTPDSVPDKDTTVVIQRNGNWAIDVTDLVHPTVARHVEFAARVIGLDIAGIDVIAEDIGRPLEDQGGVIIEVNAGPGLHIHVAPEMGTPRPVGAAIVATMFDPEDNGRIPIVSVMGNSDTEPITRLIAHLLSSTIANVGQASSDGKFVAGIRIAKGDCRDAESAAGLLANPLVEAAVLEASFESLLEEGLAFDQCQVAVVTSIGEGHKLDLEEWEEKKALIYRSASDVVPRDGAVVLKAGEPLGSILSEKCPGETILFSADENEPALVTHRASGGKAVFARDQDIILASEAQEFSLSQSLGAGKSQIILPAVAAAWALAIPDGQIAAALRSFR